MMRAQTSIVIWIGDVVRPLRAEAGNSPLRGRSVNARVGELRGRLSKRSIRRRGRLIWSTGGGRETARSFEIASFTRRRDLGRGIGFLRNVRRLPIGRTGDRGSGPRVVRVGAEVRSTSRGHSDDPALQGPSD